MNMTDLEFIAGVLSEVPSVTVSTPGEQPTRNMLLIKRWHKEGKELIFHGIKLKETE